MKTTLKVTFRDMHVSEALEAYIGQQVEKLENVIGPLQSCEVVILKEHHQSQTKAFQVRIKINLDGEETVVSHDTPANEVTSDPYQVVRNAFEIARRQLQEFRQRQRGEVKQHTVANQ